MYTILLVEDDVEFFFHLKTTCDDLFNTKNLLLLSNNIAITQWKQLSSDR